MAPTVVIRPAEPRDAEAVTTIYNRGIEQREATFETRPRQPNEIAGWLDEGRPFLVATDDTGRVLGFARVSAYSVRTAYAGRGRARRLRRPGGARPQRRRPVDATRWPRRPKQAGYYKLTSRVFTTNAASLALHRASGFTEVGVQRRHGRLDGEWKDTVLVERLLGDAAR